MSVPNQSHSIKWHRDHHLVEKEGVRTVLVPISTAETSSTETPFEFQSVHTKVIAFAPENAVTRQPALWRSLIISSNDSNTRKREYNAGVAAPCKKLALALDSVAVDWQAEEHPPLPSPTATEIVQERYQSLIYETVVSDYLPRLLWQAILEEVQSAFLKQSAVAMTSVGTARTTQSAVLSSHPQYYQRPPQQYLTPPPPAEVGAAPQRIPVTITPNQLVQKIKMGCSLIWEHNQRTVPSNDRRSSSRIARLQQPQVVDPTLQWKVVSGGRIASWLFHELSTEGKTELHERICLDGASKTTELGGIDSNLQTVQQSVGSGAVEGIEMSNPLFDELKRVTLNDATAAKIKDEGALNDFVDIEQSSTDFDQPDDEDYNGGSDNENEELADVLHNNPYLKPTRMAVMEWIGRKTAKLLNAEDLQPFFSSIILPVRSKKKKVVCDADVGEQVHEIFSDVDKLVWGKILENPSILLSDASKVVLELTSEEETSDIEHWETSYFGRAMFVPRVLNETFEANLLKNAKTGISNAEQEYREKKAWATWRYKSIVSGYTVFPSWIEAVSSRWKDKIGRPMNDTHLTEESKKEEPVDVPGDQDLALAQSLANEESAARSSRRTTRRAVENSAVYYGSQSTMTPKQLMDTILRLVSHKHLQTTKDLLIAAPDDSSDPLHRIRTSIGRLIWRRNQLAKIPVQVDWSDEAVRNKLARGSLFEVQNSDHEENGSGSACPELSDLTSYCLDLHRIEVRLRKLLLSCLSEIPIAIIASAADERPGSMESMDDQHFEDQSSIEWRSEGHELLQRLIYRPAEKYYTDDLSPCYWYIIKDYSLPVEMVEDDGEVGGQDRPAIGSARESPVVERRMRFRAYPVSHNGSPLPHSTGPILLTEAQGFAALKAAELEVRQSASTTLSPHPFARSSSAQISLVPDSQMHSADIVTCSIVGHDTLVDEFGHGVHRILLIPDEAEDAVWASIQHTDCGVIQCSLEGRDGSYTVQQFEFHSASAAFKECRAIITQLEKMPKARPFLEPVDPVALGVPDYPKIVKNPMDLSTLLTNLENGKYSNIPPGQSVGRNPTARMLNGPFKEDLLRIFDNAMLFNPPDDWIHQAAASLKKLALKKIEQASLSPETNASMYTRPRRSIYVDEDSDVDLYQYESDKDDDYDGGTRSKRKRGRESSKKATKEDSCLRAIERPVRLGKTVSDSLGLRGPFANLPINSEASTFSLPMNWGCRRRQCSTVGVENVETNDAEKELNELLALHRYVEQSEAANLRRSTRTHMGEDIISGGRGEQSSSSALEYIAPFSVHDPDQLPRNRLEVEVELERLHEEYFAKLYWDHSKKLKSVAEFGNFADGSFPPYLGRVQPANSLDVVESWEIRNPYVVAAVKWVLRGLVASKHLCDLDGQRNVVDSAEGGTVLVNNCYYIDPRREPYAIIDIKSAVRRKRANEAAESSSEEEVELSAYEKQRAERVARNRERLEQLGLA